MGEAADGGFLLQIAGRLVGQTAVSISGRRFGHHQRAGFRP